MCLIFKISPFHQVTYIQNKGKVQKTDEISCEYALLIANLDFLIILNFISLSLTNTPQENRSISVNIHSTKNLFCPKRQQIVRATFCYKINFLYLVYLQTYGRFCEITPKKISHRWPTCLTKSAVVALICILKSWFISQKIHNVIGHLLISRTVLQLHY